MKKTIDYENYVKSSYTNYWRGIGLICLLILTVFFISVNLITKNESNIGIRQDELLCFLLKSYDDVDVVSEYHVSEHKNEFEGFVVLRGYMFDVEKKLKNTIVELSSEVKTKQDTKTKQFFSEVE